MKPPTRWRRAYPRIQRSPAGDTIITRSQVPLELYTCKADHRHKPNKKKSKWSIPEEDEVECFEEALANGWRINKPHKSMCWGLIPDNRNQPTVVGHAPPDYTRELVFARFDEGNPSAWHGCPADYQGHTHDTPTPGVLSAWLALDYITKAQMRRILCGQIHR